MARATGETALHGAIGGFLAGAVVLLWFLVLDLLTIGSFGTPGLLAQTILGSGAGGASYAVLHFLVFGTIGAAAAATLVGLDVRPTVPIGIAAGGIVPTGVVYLSLLATGANALNVLPAAHVLGANAAGGVAMMAYLHHAIWARPDFGPLGLLARPLIANGLLTGFLGGSAVAVWFLLVDIVSGRPFFTPAALGSAFLLGATSATEVQVAFGVVGAYTLVHFAAFFGVGLALSWSASLLERLPSWWLIWLLAFIVIEGVFIGTVGGVAGWVLGALSWWAIGLGHLIAVAVMAWFAWVTHPTLARQLREVAHTRV